MNLDQIEKAPRENADTCQLCRGVYMLEMYCLQILVLDFRWSTLIKVENREVTGYVLK